MVAITLKTCRKDNGMYWIIMFFLNADNVKQLQGYLDHILEYICMNMVMAQKYIN